MAKSYTIEPEFWYEDESGNRLNLSLSELERRLPTLDADIASWGGLADYPEFNSDISGADHDPNPWLRDPLGHIRRIRVCRQGKVPIKTELVPPPGGSVGTMVQVRLLGD